MTKTEKLTVSVGGSVQGSTSIWKKSSMCYLSQDPKLLTISVSHTQMDEPGSQLEDPHKASCPAL